MHGQCLCGAVKLETAPQTHVHACHCGICRRWSGGPVLAVACGTEVAFVGEENINRYASSEWAERGFCKQCGTHLFSQVNATGDYYVPTGLFTDAPELTLAVQFFIDKKPSFYAFANETDCLTEQQFLDQFS